jgi:hypothetical protein
LSWLTELWEEVLRVLWLALPVVVAAIVHIVVIRLDWMAGLKKPLDGGRTYKEKRLFGDNKTWRGLIVYTLVSMVATIPQTVWRLPDVEYPGLSGYYGSWQGGLLIGFLLGLGFALGELPNSFWKRQRGIGAGKRGPVFFVILDQVDSLIGCLLLLGVIWLAPPLTWAVVLVSCTLLHVAVNGIFVALGLKKSVF